jgi:hypothetical protein
MSKCQVLLRPLKNTPGAMGGLSFPWKGSRLTVCHASSAEVGLLPTATDLASLITITEMKTASFKGLYAKICKLSSRGTDHNSGQF